MRPTRGLGSAPLPPANRGCTLLLGLAPGRVCRVSLRPLRQAGAVGIVTVALVLASRRTGVTRYPALRSSDFPRAATRPRSDATRGHPAASLAPRSLRAPRRTAEAARPPSRRASPISRTAGPRPTPGRRPGRGRSPRCTGRRRRGSRRAGRARRSSGRSRAGVRDASPWSGLSFASLTRHRPWSCSTMSIESSSSAHLARAELGGQPQGPDDGGVLGHVVRLDAEVVRDRGVGRRRRVERVRPLEVDQHRAGRGVARVGPRRPIGADDEAGQRRGRPFERGPERLVQSFGSPGNIGSSTPAADPGVRPRSFRQAHWSGS